MKDDAARNKHTALLTCTAGILQLKYIKLHSCSMRAKQFSVYLLIVIPVVQDRNNDDNANKWLSILILIFYVISMQSCWYFCVSVVKEKIYIAYIKRKFLNNTYRVVPLALIIKMIVITNIKQ